VRTPVTATPSFTWDEDARRVLSAPGGFRRVLGGPGTGKTALLASAATRRIAEGADPESVLVLTTSRRSADALRADITRRLTADPDLARPLPRTVREPLVRTVHSYAYSLLRLEAMADASLPAKGPANGWPPWEGPYGAGGNGRGKAWPARAAPKV